MYPFDFMTLNFALIHICHMSIHLSVDLSLSDQMPLKEKSRFWPYIQTLPKNLAHLPLLTDLDLDSLLKAGPAADPR